jgi:hypothetical protein
MYMKSNEKSQFLKILETDSLSDIALIKSVLDAEGIRYFIQGENMKFLRPGDQPAYLMVHEQDAQDAITLLKPLDLKFTRDILRTRS